MRIKFHHIKYMADKIAIDLNKREGIRITSGMDKLKKAVEDKILQDSQKEHLLEQKVKQMIEENESDIDFYMADEKELFRLIKRKLAPDYDVVLNTDERYSILSSAILDELYEEDLINYDISENQVKNIIYGSIDDFLDKFVKIEEVVEYKMSKYKRAIEHGTTEYDVMFEKLYEEELVKRGMK